MDSSAAKTGAELIWWLQIKHWGPEGEGMKEGLQPGDVLASNHPQLAGGSHLPDITVITPVFSEGAIVFFVASRGHHADVGGITPGSMPPNSHSLVEEGAAILSFKLVKLGAFQVSAACMVPDMLPSCLSCRLIKERVPCYPGSCGSLPM